MDNQKILQRGYLVDDFRVFRLKDASLGDIPFHYHDFHKIILFLAGECDYIIEGRTWHLSPRDIIFVRSGEIHRPIPRKGVPYERIVIYIAPRFLRKFPSAQKTGRSFENGGEKTSPSPESQESLGQCFIMARDERSVMHLTAGHTHDLLFHMEKFERVSHESGYLNGLYTEMLFVELMILLNRAMIDGELDETSAAFDKKIQPVITFINDHLTEKIDIDELAKKFFVSRSYLMHRFKDATGYGIQKYITKKRLGLARARLVEERDETISAIGESVGFEEYVTFLRAFKSEFHSTPADYRKQYERK